MARVTTRALCVMLWFVEQAECRDVVVCRPNRHRHICGAGANSQKYLCNKEGDCVVLKTPEKYHVRGASVSFQT